MTKSPEPFPARVKNHLKNDLDLLILVAAAIVLTFLGIAGTPDDLLNPTIVALLGALAFSQLKSRDQVAAVTATWHRSRTALLLRGFPEEYYAARSAASHNYFFAGTTMSRTLPTMSHDLRRILNNGGSVRILLPDPHDQPLMEMIAKTHPSRPPEAVRRAIENALSQAEDLCQSDRGQLEIRTIRFLPSIGINALDLGHPSESIMVQMYEFRTNSQKERAPIFYLTAKDGEWIRHFTDQIDRMWKNGVQRFPQP
ncbi:hypothetical protein [Microbacterium sp. A93]|uniref:hypothetical protein n=1 Tax=Microbacterium sp. A93 TaxID=3450716 RepID=UPI003F442965